MREIEKRMNEAINARHNWKSSNTEVEIYGNFAFVRLYGNTIIAHDYKTGRRYFSIHGWNTSTTRSRLNAAGAGIRCKNGEAITNSGEAWKDAGGRFDAIETLRIAAIFRFNLPAWIEM